MVKTNKLIGIMKAIITSVVNIVTLMKICEMDLFRDRILILPTQILELIMMLLRFKGRQDQQVAK